ncbi:hypothetical protein BH11ACT8_BH11ACT8_29410 [soil metagenome]
MVERLQRGLFLGALAMVTITGYLAAHSAPGDGYATGIWPVGLASGLVIMARPRRMPVVLALVLVVAAGTVMLGGRPFDVAIGYAVGVTVELWVMARILRTGQGRPALRSDQDLRRWLLACVAAVAVGASVVTLTSAITGFGHPANVGLAIGAAHLASQLCVTPFFLELPEQGAIARRGERIAQWCVILVGTPVLFFPDAAPSLVFLAIPILAWGALRITPRESLGQMVAVVGLAIVLTTFDRGPFADVPTRYAVSDDVRGVLLSAFAITCAIIVVPLTLRVGEYVRAMRSATSERDLVRSIVDSANGIAIIGTDRGGLITLFNPGAERLLGYRAKDVVGSHLTVLHTADAIRDKAEELGVGNSFADVIQAVQGPGREGSLLRFRREDGVERTHAVTLTRLADARGRPTGYVSTSEDVTDALAAESALREALSAEQQAVERLRDVDAVKDAFVSTVSHELRTPITSILGYLELMGDGSLGDLDRLQRDALARVSTNSHRLLALIDDLLTLSKVAEHGVQPVRHSFDLRDGVAAAYAVVTQGWSVARRVSTTLQMPPDPVVILGDRDMLERVVVNLVGNAVKFTPDGGRVSVELSASDGSAEIRVEDTGIGVPEGEQAQLFARFFRSSLARGRAIPGSGLGLSITRAIVERHGGSIGVTSQVGVGTTMVVRLPQAGNVQDSTTVVAIDRPGERPGVKVEVGGGHDAREDS